MKGPIWKAVRGKGLAYSYSLNLGVDEGLLRLFLGMSSNIVQAYKETEKILVRVILLTLF
jgi:Zn-dependent M16 (insulinase) family peptidase